MVPVKGYEGIFSIDEFGNLLSHRTNRILKQVVRKDGRVTVATRIGGRAGKSICFKIHRLVAEAFIANPDDKPQVNHIDGNPKNNHVSNLEWVTASENIQHAYDNGLMSKPSDTEHWSAINDEMKKRILSSSGSSRSVGEKLGISHFTVNKYRNKV